MRTKLMHFAIGSLLFTPFSAFAAPCPNSPQQQGFTDVGGGACNSDRLTNAIGRIIDTLFLVIGAIAVIILLVGGIRYITSDGNPQLIEKAKNTILYAIIGLAVAILARAIVGFVIGRLL